MFFTYLRRELRRRRKAALVVASGLALGIALVIVVSSVSSGMGNLLRSAFPFGVMGSDPSRTTTLGTIGSGSLSRRDCRISSTSTSPTT